MGAISIHATQFSKQIHPCHLPYTAPGPNCNNPHEDKISSDLHIVWCIRSLLSSQNSWNNLWLSTSATHYSLAYIRIFQIQNRSKPHDPDIKNISEQRDCKFSFPWPWKEVNRYFIPCPLTSVVFMENFSQQVRHVHREKNEQLYFEIEIERMAV